MAPPALVMVITSSSLQLSASIIRSRNQDGSGEERTAAALLRLAACLWPGWRLLSPHLSLSASLLTRRGFAADL